MNRYGPNPETGEGFSEHHGMMTDIGISADIASDFPLALSDEADRFGQSYIPGFSGFSYGTPMRSDLSVTLTESLSHELIQLPHALRWGDSWNNQLNLDFFHAMYAMMRIECLERSLFPTHAAAVGTETGDHILLAAYPSNGKTSTLLHLVGEYGFNVFSGDKTVLSVHPDSHTMEGVAGTRAITARDVVFERYAPSLAADRYLDRKAVFLPDSQYEQRQTVPIKAIMIVREDPAVAEFERMNAVSATHRLLPFFLDETNAHKVFTDSDGAIKGVIEGNTPPGILLKLAARLSGSLRKTPTYLVTGSIPFLGEQISRTYAET